MIIVTLLPHLIPIQSPSNPHHSTYPPSAKRKNTPKNTHNVKSIRLPQKAYKQYETLLYIKNYIYIVYNNKHTLFPSVLCVRFPLSPLNRQYVSILIRIDVSRIVFISRGGFMGFYGVLWGFMGCTWRETSTIHQYDSPIPICHHSPNTRHAPPYAV